MEYDLYYPAGRLRTASPLAPIEAKIGADDVEAAIEAEGWAGYWVNEWPIVVVETGNKLPAAARRFLKQPH